MDDTLTSSSPRPGVEQLLSPCGECCIQSFFSSFEWKADTTKAKATGSGEQLTSKSTSRLARFDGHARPPPQQPLSRTFTGTSTLSSHEKSRTFPPRDPEAPSGMEVSYIQSQLLRQSLSEEEKGDWWPKALEFAWPVTDEDGQPSVATAALWDAEQWQGKEKVQSKQQLLNLVEQKLQTAEYEWKAERNRLKATIDQLTADKRGLTSVLKESERKRARDKKKYRKARVMAETDDLRQQLADMCELSDKLQALAKKQAEEAIMQDYMRVQLVEALQRKDSEVCALRAQLSAANQQLTDKSAQLATAEAEIVKLNDQGDAYGEELIRAQAVIAGMEETIKATHQMGGELSAIDSYEDTVIGVDDDTMPLLDEALALAHVLTDKVREQGDDVDMLDLLRNLSDMFDEFERTAATASPVRAGTLRPASPSSMACVVVPDAESGNEDVPVADSTSVPMAVTAWEVSLLPPAAPRPSASPHCGQVGGSSGPAIHQPCDTKPPRRILSRACVDAYSLNQDRSGWWGRCECL